MGKLIDFKVRDAKGLRINSKDNITAEIILYGAIGADRWDENSVSAKQFSDALNTLDKNVKNLNIRINSPGGDVFDGIAIYNRIKQYKGNVTIYVDALAASIASIIMLAGDKIVIGDGALVMVHKPWTWAIGNADDLETTIARLDDVEEQMISIYAKRTGKSRAELRTMLANTTWMNADEAISNKFVDAKFEDGFRAAAKLDVPWLNKRPESIVNKNEIVKNKLTELKKSIEGYLTR